VIPGQPELRTDRLLLRRFRRSDAPAACSLAGDRDVAANTVNIRHPYALHQADAWIASHGGQLERGEAVTYAITTLRDAALVGAASLIFDAPNDAAELGYWIGKPYWGRGYATEAVRALLGWGFGTRGLHRIHASHFPSNAASGAVLRKVGMRYEGRSRGQVKKGGEYRDLERYGLLRHEFSRAAPEPRAEKGLWTGSCLLP
jgi:[ribosomal protein S5]-alanine N-acetyltransferase